MKYIKFSLYGSILSRRVVFDHQPILNRHRHNSLLKKCGTGILPVILLALPPPLWEIPPHFTGWKPVPHRRTKFFNNPEGIRSIIE